MISIRKPVGLALYVSGGLMLSFAGGRYAVGAYQADMARAAWSQSEARAAVALARSMALHHGRRETLVAGAPMARVVIPRIGLDAIVLEGVDGDELNAGPGHLPGSAYPGEQGNSVISAHRDRHFSHLDALDVGDTVITESGTHVTTWEIVAKRVVDKNDRALFRTRDATLTLTTCWPIRYVGPAPERLILTAKPIRQRAGTSS